LSEVQYGAFARWQVLAAGGDDALIGRRLRSGRWSQPILGVYAVVGYPPSFRRSLSIARLGLGVDAVVSLESAAQLHGFSSFPPNRFTLTVPHGSHGRSPIAEVHQSRAAITPVTIEGFPVTPASRTLVDLGKRCGPRRLGHALDDAIIQGKVSLAAVQREFLDLAAQGRNGITTMRQVLTDRGEDKPVPRSVLESELDSILAMLPVTFQHEAPLPALGFDKQRVDRILFEPVRLIVEGDGRTWHGRLEQMARDRQRDRANLAAGFPTVRYTHAELTQQRTAIYHELLVLLGLKPGFWRQ